MSSTFEFTKICEYCGASFIARKSSTRFCSKRCAEHAYKDRKRAEHVEQNQSRFDASINDDVKALDFLSPTQCAKLFGVCRRSLYYYLQSNQIPCFQYKGKTRIRRADIEKLFDEVNGYVKRLAKEREPITEFYTTKEVLAKFGISNSWLFKIVKDKNIPKTVSRGKTLWSKKHCNDLFGLKPSQNAEITEWYSADEICAKYGMSLGQVYNLANRHNIPKKKVGNVTSYSKRHVDAAKGIIVDDEPKWYSYAEAMAKYQLTHDQICHYVRTYKITKKQVGKYAYILQSEFDELMSPRIL